MTRQGGASRLPPHAAGVLLAGALMTRLGGAATILDDQAFLDAVRPAVVQVVVDDGSGSGFVLNAGGHIATNHHVAAGSARFTVQQGARSARAELVWSSEALDLAVIRTHMAGLRPLVLAVSPPPELTDVTAVGFPGIANAVSISTAAEPTFSEGNIGRRVAWGTWDGRTMLRIVQHTAQISPGNSGGPLMDGCARVVGVNTAIPAVTIENNPGGPADQRARRRLLGVVHRRTRRATRCPGNSLRIVCRCL